MKAAIKLQALTKSYRDAGGVLEVLQKVDAQFEAGSSVAIVGRSGVGKSTLLHILGGLDRPSAGQVFYGETDLGTLNDEALSSFRGKNIGFIFQFHHLLPEFTALENVCMPLLITGQAEAQAQTQARELLVHLGLKDRLTHRPAELSGGEQQRVAIARALVAKPKAILADEPTGNLDMHTAELTRQLLLDMQAELGSTLIIVTHNMELARSMQFVFEMLPGGCLRRL